MQFGNGRMVEVEKTTTGWKLSGAKESKIIETGNTIVTKEQKFTIGNGGTADHVITATTGAHAEITPSGFNVKGEVAHVTNTADKPLTVYRGNEILRVAKGESLPLKEGDALSFDLSTKTIIRSTPEGI